MPSSAEYLQALSALRSGMESDYQDPYQQIPEPSDSQKSLTSGLDIAGTAAPGIGAGIGTGIGALLGMAGGPLAGLTVPVAASVGGGLGGVAGALLGGGAQFASGEMRRPYEEAAMRAQARQQQIQQENQRRASQRSAMMSALQMMRGM